MAEISMADMQQLYLNTVMLYHGQPCMVEDINAGKGGYSMLLHRLMDGERLDVPFEDHAFKPPAVRLGMINQGNDSFYGVRVPVRRYMIGLSKNNFKVHHLQGADRSAQFHHNMAAAGILTGQGLFKTIKGLYPSFKECLTFVRKYEGSQAFDRQFAVDSENAIFYKSALVGRIPKNCSKVETIVWNKGSEHLAAIVNGDGYEASVSASRA